MPVFQRILKHFGIVTIESDTFLGRFLPLWAVQKVRFGLFGQPLSKSQDCEDEPENRGAGVARTPIFGDLLGTFLRFVIY